MGRVRFPLQAGKAYQNHLLFPVQYLKLLLGIPSILLILSNFGLSITHHSCSSSGCPVE
jgi:hypothetical protein